jgi:hypothetical protein
MQTQGLIFTIFLFLPSTYLALSWFGSALALILALGLPFIGFFCVEKGINTVIPFGIIAFVLFNLSRYRGM